MAALYHSLLPELFLTEQRGKAVAKASGILCWRDNPLANCRIDICKISSADKNC